MDSSIFTSRSHSRPRSPSSIFILLALCVALVYYVSPALACLGQTLERCFNERGCSGGRFCLGRNAKKELVSCPSPNTPECFCGPRNAFLDCNSDSDCPMHEGCVISPRTKRRICAGCKVLDETKRNYKPVQPNSPKCANDKRQICGRSLDFCTVNAPCHPQLECVDRVSETIAFLCSEQSTACRCEPIGGQTFFSPCVNNNNKLRANRQQQCPYGETCTYATFTNVNACLSCSVGRTDLFFRAFLQPCDKVPLRPNPKYQTAPNGLSYDLCSENIQCTNMRTCRQFVDIMNPLQGRQKCSSTDNLCFCVPPRAEKCNTDKDCKNVGESCATIPRVGITKSCVSNAMIESIPKNRIQVFPDPPNSKAAAVKANRLIGFGTTGDPCKFDWDCRPPRRCTHLRDAFGGCAGRNACTCEPLQRELCSTDTDCFRDEKCVNYVDGKTRPFCLSNGVVSKNKNIQGPMFKRPMHTAVPGAGLTGDPCRGHSDCKTNRSCQHANEVAGGCRNRAFCFCQSEKNSNACTKSTDCDAGEICVIIKDEVPRAPTCLSQRAVSIEFPKVNQEIGKRNGK